MPRPPVQDVDVPARPTVPVLGVMVLMLLTVVAYWPAVRGPQIFDDVQTIQTNSTIRQLWPVTVPLTPPPLTPVSGRPVVNYSLALDYKLNELLGVDQRDDPDGPDKTLAFHLTNLGIHIACGLLLFGLVRRTLGTGRFGREWAEKANGTALFITALWLLHPLQTEAVDYLTQRTELMVGLCGLTTIYCSVRAWDAATARTRQRWLVASVMACLLGMGSKEVMFGAPFLVVLYDRAFRVNSWGELFSGTRRWYYAALFGTLALLAALVAGAPRSATAGFHLGIPWYEYFHSQGWAIMHYLWLVFWPARLTLDYGPYAIPHWRGVPGLLLLTTLFALTCYAWTKVERWGWAAFLGAWFFLILAPSSSILPVATEVAAERRFYLPLAAVVILLVILGVRASERWRVPILAMRVGAASLLVALMAVTFARSRTYQSNEGIWRDALAKYPENARAYNNLGVVIGNLPTPRLTEAESLYHHALALDSNYVNAMSNLAITAVGRQEYREAEQWFGKVLALEPENRAALNGEGSALLWRGDTVAALPYLEQLAAISASPELLINLGALYESVGRHADALKAFEQVRAGWPDRTDLMLYLGGMLLDEGHPEMAQRYLGEALAREPDAPDGLALMSLADAEVGRTDDAIQSADRAVRAGGDAANVYFIAGRAMLAIKRVDLAEPYLARAVELDPKDSSAVAALNAARAASRDTKSGKGKP